MWEHQGYATKAIETSKSLFSKCFLIFSVYENKILVARPKKSDSVRNGSEISKPMKNTENSATEDISSFAENIKTFRSRNSFFQQFKEIFNIFQA